ncbi:conjugative transposon protein TraJ [Dyadobacter frigoris]|uniref:type IV secretion system protein n=1 Tax=Dyadobacter frigoris TaxID=2576211 RepID=UPI0024A3625D|nr:type IV secretion system protein [Dyadobacter frigoris]GLU56508.1 conjugative transposon protein TraJ [Dyadobacter frigoris]
MSSFMLLADSFGSADLLKVIDLMYTKQIAANTYGSAIGSELLTASRGIAGIAGLFYIGSKISGQIVRNEGINFIPLLRPFALMILIGLIPDIATLIDTTFEKVAVVAKADSESVKLRVAELQKKREQAVKRKWQQIEENDDAYNTEFGEPDDDMFKSVSKAFNIATGKMADDFKSALYDFTQAILSLLGDIAYIILYLISAIYRIILRVIAPLAIAFAIFDGLSNNVIEWFGKYINYALLPMVAGIYQNIAVTLNMGFLDEMMISGDMSSTLPSQDPFAFGLVYTGVLIILLVLYTQIPSITNMIMVVGGSSGMVQGLTGKAVAAGGAAKRMGGMRVGGGGMNTSAMGTAGAMGTVVQQMGAQRGMGNILGSNSGSSSGSGGGGGNPSGRSGTFAGKPNPKTTTVS